jgi:hypothetical protein
MAAPKLHRNVVAILALLVRDTPAAFGVSAGLALLAAALLLLLRPEKYETIR